MPANAYPHLVFATDATTLPRTELESLVAEVFGDAEPAPSVEQGPLQAIVRLGDYAFTLWYDDDSEGLPGRYADFAPTLKRRRISKCTTMIDFSGEADPDGAHGEDARRLTEALAQRAGVYVFSEEAKAFVGMDEEDPFADTFEPTTGRPEERVEEQVEEPAAVSVPGEEPVARSADEPLPGAAEEPTTQVAPPVPAPESEPLPEFDTTPGEDPTRMDEPIVAQSVEMPVPQSAPEEKVEAEVEPAPEQPAPDVAPVQPEPVEAQPELVEAPATPETRPEPSPARPQPAQPQKAAEEKEEKEGGFFKRLFGRRR